MSSIKEAKLIHNLSEQKDLFKIGACLEANGHFDRDRKLKQVWWLHCFVCLLL